MPILTTSRLQLRHLTLDDAEFILRQVNEPTWLQYIGDKGVRDLDGARKYLTDGPMNLYQSKGFGLYAVELREGGGPIGMCGLIKRDTLPDADIGYAFLPEHFGKGYAVEAGTATVEHARRDFGMKRLLGLVSPDNAGSIRVLEKLGLAFERAEQMRPDGMATHVYARDL
jgi:RimJ/RimL family protein N-acetyltransferase